MSVRVPPPFFWMRATPVGLSVTRLLASCSVTVQPFGLSPVQLLKVSSITDVPSFTAPSTCAHCLPAMLVLRLKPAQVGTVDGE
jgi:hypothetical protein